MTGSIGHRGLNWFQAIAILVTLALSGCARGVATSETPAAVTQVRATSAWTRQSQTGNGYAVVHSFVGGRDGDLPFATLIADASGNLYGTTLFGGAAGCPAANAGCGVVFEINAPANAANESVLYAFKGGVDGQYPTSPLLDVNGILYGTTTNGGSTQRICATSTGQGCGTVFALSLATRTESVLYRFLGGADGAIPSSGLTIDATGALYGSIESGLPVCTARCGMVYRVTPAGQKTVVSALPSPNGFSSAPTITPAGAMVVPGYSAECWQPPRSLWLLPTLKAGCAASGGGSVYLVASLSSSASHVPAIVYTFQGGPQGSGLYSPVVVTSNGVIFGTTLFGGILTAQCPQGCGTVFSLTPTMHGSYTEQTLHAFAGTPTDGALPLTVTFDPATGKLYGTTQGGGVYNGCDNGCGVIYELSPSAGGTYTERILHAFAGSPDGWSPAGGVVLVNGQLYGTTAGGGTSTHCGGGCGTVFRVQP